MSNPDTATLTLDTVLATFPALHGTGESITVSRDALNEWIVAHSKWMPETCEMVHEEPFDFAECTVHDKTFALGEECPFKGRVLWERWAEVADEQRGLKVRAEMTVGHLVWVLGDVLRQLTDADLTPKLREQIRDEILRVDM